ncbi:M15 family metallopeptidase [Xanthobacter sp. DSM 24535]|uniref:M15 family metallopeptidase n=1 Tax=Roseixanthobacter psychrophilus TaxID=3119917 RepID=UPI0037279379
MQVVYSADLPPALDRTPMIDRIVKPAAFALAMGGLMPAARADEAPPSDFVDVASVVPSARFDVRYHGADNFVGTRVDGYEAPRCYLTRPAAAAVAAVAQDVGKDGLALLIFDCYRPTRAVAHFARWAADLADQHTKAEYYPDVDKKDLFAEGYIAARSGHSRGSTLDLTLVEAAGGRELDMGTPFDLFSPRSWPADHSVSPQQRANRRRLTYAMIRNGFVPFEKEWWHFTLAEEPFPDTYFDFPIR